MDEEFGFGDEILFLMRSYKYNVPNRYTAMTDDIYERWQMTDILIWVSMEASGCQELKCGLKIIFFKFWKWEQANENFDNISPYDRFVNENGLRATSKSKILDFKNLYLCSGLQNTHYSLQSMRIPEKPSPIQTYSRVSLWSPAFIRTGMEWNNRLWLSASLLAGRTDRFPQLPPVPGQPKLKTETWELLLFSLHLPLTGWRANPVFWGK